MNYLSIDTSSKLCSVTLFNNDKFYIHEEEGKEGHSETLSSLCKKFNQEKLKSIDFIALSIGPGSYSGLRIGSSFSKGLALSLGIPIVPVCTFDGINYSLKNKNKYYISIYSHRDYAFYQLYNDGKKSGQSKCGKIENMLEYNIYGYGFDESLKNDRFVNIKPSSKDIGQIALNNFSSLNEKKIDNIKPIYLEIEK
tara:strand:- start:1151 stop:1738 length:588 start_codon:yes stop_codon:yes gene_type:complete